MKVIAAYLLAQLGGNPNPTLEDVESILSSVSISLDEKTKANALRLIAKLNVQDVDDIIKEGKLIMQTGVEFSRFMCPPSVGEHPRTESEQYREPGGVSLDVGSVQGAIGRGRSTVQVVIDVVTGTPDKIRPPVNLAIVLDRSGSMSGDKIDCCREAIVEVLSQLAPSDKVHFVVYDTNPNVIFKNQSPSVRNVTELMTAVRNIRPGCTTNLWGGIQLGLECLEEAQDPTRINRMLLFSDGCVNAGKYIDDASILDAVRKVAVNHTKTKVMSFGVGKEFNEDLMQGIGEVGEGRYYFVNLSKNVGPFVEQSLKSILEPVALDPFIHFSKIWGWEVKRVLGNYKKLSETPVGDLGPLTTKSFFVELEGKREEGAVGEKEIVGKVRLNYRNAGGEQVVIEKDVAVIVTDDEEIIKQSESDRCKAMFMIASSSSIDKEVQLCMGIGDYEGAIEHQKSLIKHLWLAANADRERCTKAIYLWEDAKNNLKKLEDVRDSGVGSEYLVKRLKQRQYLKEEADDDDMGMALFADDDDMGADSFADLDDY